MTADASADQPESRSQNPPIHLRHRISLTVGCVICILLTLWLSSTLGVPQVPRRAGILLQQSNWPVAIGVSWLLIIGGAAVSAIIASRLNYDGGLFCACVGMAALSVRLGPARYALFIQPASRVFLTFALEQILLFIPIAAAWWLLHQGSRRGMLPAEIITEEEAVEEPVDQKVLATVAHSLVMILVMMLLCQTDAKNQVLASVVIAAYVASLAVHSFIPARPSVWFWSGPFIVGMFGYLAQYFTHSPQLVIGDMTGFFAPLARAMPIDYASLGTAGALLGYWTSQRWHRNRIETELES